MTKFYWIVGVIFFGAIVWFAFSGGGSSINPPLELGVVNPVDHIKGLNPASSTVVLMEYSDFQCPACHAYYPILRQITQEFGGQITFVYRHFPLTSIHANAEFAARASEAAAKQDKFWEMHDLLFEKQAEWEGENDIGTMFTNYATLLSLDVEKFKSDWKSNEIKNLVSAYRNHALKSGLQGTPTFFLNGKKIENPTSVDAFRALIKAEIDKNTTKI